MLNYDKQSGFSILSIILFIIVLILAITLWTLSGKNNPSSSSAIEIQAATIINDSSTIKLAYDTFIIQGEAPRNIRFLPNVSSTSIAPNILDPINGISLTQPNLKSLRNSNLNPSDGLWILGSINIKGLGLEGIFDFEQAILLTGIQDSVCQSINKTIHGSSFIPPTTAINSASFVSNFSSPININNPNSNVALQIVNMTNITGWTSGCLGANNNLPDHNMYFRVLHIQ